MASETTASDLFRFTQLRPQRLVAEVETIPLLSGTPFAIKLIGSRPAQRTPMANAVLKSGTEVLTSIADLPLGPEILEALAALATNAEATVADLLSRIPGHVDLVRKPVFDIKGSALSNTLLATYYATESFPPRIPDLEQLHRVYHLLRLNRDGILVGTLSLPEVLRRPLLAPPTPTDLSPRPGTDRGRRVAVAPAEPSLHTTLSAAVSELTALDRSTNLVAPGKLGTAPARGEPFTLTSAARNRVSKSTTALLKTRGIDLTTTPIDRAVQLIWDEQVLTAGTVLEWPVPPIVREPGATLPPVPERALVKPAGVADLLVVKQQIKRYEGGEIAHVENVLIGEKKSRAHRQLDRTEETFATDKETTNQRETELTTADRFELNREASVTVEADSKLGFGLSLSGKYGPSVEFTAANTMENSTHREESSKSSSRYAKDVVNRSLERVTERTREQRTRTTIHETEETNLHELSNPGTATNHIRGVYQFLDKVYEAQVFNYGIREMFDFMIPEPASFLWHVDENPTLDVKLPPAPPKLESVIADYRFITESNAPWLAATYGTTDIEPPPPVYKRLTVLFKHGTDDASEGGQPHSNSQVDGTIPAGYRPLRARIQGLAFTDNNPVIAIAIGAQQVVWQPGGADRVALSDGKRLAYKPQLYMDLESEPFEFTAEAKLGISLLAWETNTYTVNVLLVLQRTPEEMDRWRLATYKKIRAAYDDAMTRYEQTVAALQAAAEAKAAAESRRPYGSPPAENLRTISTELKKHCITIITQQRYDAFDAIRGGAPPYFDFDDAIAEGAYIRFFEQAFEWDQLQYVFYPYFWARKETWVRRFVKQDVDPTFLDFLRAGSARVVVPVRPGFEKAITHFIETGKIWGGEGEPPLIHNPLYVSIVDEIRERTGAPRGEVPVGDPWDVRVPTALVLVRDGAALPAWERVAPEEWEWRPVGEG